MNKTATDWFTTVYSNAELAEILSDFSKDVFGQRTFLPRTAGRCTLVNELELCESTVANMSRAEKLSRGWLA